jgi:tRNA A37 threonylcarbamoyladenosine modification protein TsaB
MPQCSFRRHRSKGSRLLVLAMDTATPVTTVAVGSGGTTLAEVAVRHERRHAEVLAPAVRWVLEQAEVEPDQLAAGIEARGEDVLLCGDGALAHREVLEHLDERFQFGSQAQAVPSAAALVELALPRMLREEFTRPLDVTPLYLRRPDIDPTVERRLRAGSAGGPRPTGGSGASRIGPRSTGSP